jgi:aerobic carbon-monoxide dehydrogenase small subunit
MKLQLYVNDKERLLNVEPYELLVDVLRDRLGLTGTHIGCDTSQCGACTVLVNMQAVKACSVLALQVQGQHVQTIEACEHRADWHAVQINFSSCHALQCGFCTPGMIMRTIALANEDIDPTPIAKQHPEAFITHALEGNLCRCTGYYPILDAVQQSLKQLQSSQKP